MQLKYRNINNILLITLTLFVWGYACSNETQNFEVINDFLSEYQQLYDETDSLALFYETKEIQWDTWSIFPVKHGMFMGDIMDSFYIPEELKNGQSDKQFMQNFISQKDITAWNNALRNINKKTFTWDSLKIKKFPVLKKIPYYMEQEFMPVEILEGGYPIDKMLYVSKPVFNEQKDKALLDVAILYAPLNVSYDLYLMHKTEEDDWIILYIHHYAGS